MNFLLENSVLDLLKSETVVMAIILAAIGLAMAMLAGRIAKAVRGTTVIEPTDKIMLIFKAFGLVCIIVALVLMVVAIN